jgi:hypothetical protein
VPGTVTVPSRTSRNTCKTAFSSGRWLGGIIVNLLTAEPPEYDDIALRDFGLMLGALTLARLAWALHPARATRTDTGFERGRWPGRLFAFC